MDLDIKQHLPEDFSADSKVWIYQASRLFLISEALEMEDALQNFVNSWKSHGATVKGYANLFYGRFVVLMADEVATGVSGCSTDSSVRMIKQIEKEYNVQMFDRQSLAFLVKDKIEVIPLAQLNYAVENNFITDNTPYFNNTVQTRAELENKWIIPAGESWLAKYFKTSKV